MNMLRGGAMEKEEKTEKKIFLSKIHEHRKKQENCFQSINFSLKEDGTLLLNLLTISSFSTLVFDFYSFWNDFHFYIFERLQIQII